MPWACRVVFHSMEIQRLTRQASVVLCGVLLLLCVVWFGPHQDVGGERRRWHHLRRRALHPLLQDVQTVPAPGNIYEDASEIQTGWSPRSKRSFER